ncbi:MAG: hypothetical protein QX191_08150 [Methylococcaceae bacterium]
MKSMIVGGVNQTDRINDVPLTLISPLNISRMFLSFSVSASIFIKPITMKPAQTLEHRQDTLVS